MKNKFVQYLNADVPGMHGPAHVEVNFTKADGSARNMVCLLGPDSAITDTHATVWDVKVEEYRSVRFDRITSVELV